MYSKNKNGGQRRGGNDEIPELNREQPDADTKESDDTSWSSGNDINSISQSEVELFKSLSINDLRFGKYQIERRIGRHGQADILKAFDPDLQRFVALKIYSGQINEMARDSILSEGRSLAKVDSPFVAKCFNVELVGDVPVLVIEWIDGQSLDQHIRNGEFTYRQAKQIFSKIAEGVEAIHQQDFLHRDLKPSNIIVDARGTPKIIDFGLASSKEEIGANLVGTYAYMSP